MSRTVVCVLVAAAAMGGAGCVHTEGGSAKMEALGEFANPVPVEIKGYDDHVMEPFLSRDGRYLFFNNLNSGPATKLHFAQLVTPTEFEYLGPLEGSASQALDAVPSMDQSGTFYFTSVRSYQVDQVSLYRGRFTGGAIVDVEPAGEGLTLGQLGIIDMDAEVTADGTAMYVSRAEFGGRGGPPRGSDLYRAVRKDGVFVPDDRSDELLASVNSDMLEYAPATTPNELELYFTRADFSAGRVSIFVARRRTAEEPFGEPTPLELVNDGFVEAPTLSPDGRRLYYHKKVNGMHYLYMATRG